MAVAPWIRDVAVNINNHIREVEDNIMRKRVILALMKKKGKITNNCSGNKFDWRVRYKRAPLVGYADADTLTFPRRNKWRVAEQVYRGYAVGESATKMEQLKNRGAPAIIKLFSEIVDDLVDDITDQFNPEFYIDGDASGNSKRWHGVESMFGKTSAGTSDGGRVRTPSDTYAGLDTTLSAYGGSSVDSTKWPASNNDAAYDFWSPVLIDTTNTVWGASPSFSAYGLKQIRYGIVSMQRNKPGKGQTDAILMPSTEWQQFLDLIETRERLVTQRSQNNSILINLGFGNTVNYDGVDCIWDYGIPASTVYGLNIESAELMNMQDRLFVSTGPTYFQPTKSYLIDVDIYGNFKWNPRNNFKMYPYT